MNIRPLIGDDSPFSEFNREERNCVAMLYHVLLLEGNLQRFLEQRGCTSTCPTMRRSRRPASSSGQDLMPLPEQSRGARPSRG